MWRSSIKRHEKNSDCVLGGICCRRWPGGSRVRIQTVGSVHGHRWEELGDPLNIHFRCGFSLDLRIHWAESVVLPGVLQSPCCIENTCSKRLFYLDCLKQIES